jgi:hypothetical protein
MTTEKAPDLVEAWEDHAKRIEATELYRRAVHAAESTAADVTAMRRSQDALLELILCIGIGYVLWRVSRVAIDAVIAARIPLG